MKKRFMIFFAASLLAASSFASVKYELGEGKTNDYGWIRSTDMFWAFIQKCNIGLDSTALEPGQFYDLTYEASGTAKKDAIWAALDDTVWTWLRDYLLDEVGTYWKDSSTAQTRSFMDSNPSVLRGAIDNFFNNTKINDGQWNASFDATQKGVAAYARYAKLWKAGWDGDTTIPDSVEFCVAQPYCDGKSFYGWYKEDTYTTLVTNDDIKGYAAAAGETTVYAKFGTYIPNMKELWSGAAGSTPATGIVTFVDGNKFYLQDSYAGMFVESLGAGAQAPAVGDNVRFTATLAFDGAAPKLTDAANFEKLGTDNVVAPSIQFSDVKVAYDGYMYQYVYFASMKLTAAVDGQLTFNAGSEVLYKHSSIVASNYTVGARYSVYAIATQAGGVIELTGDASGIERAAAAKPDPSQYEVFTDSISGYKYTITSNWLYSVNMGNWEANKPNPVAEQSRGMAVIGDKVYVNWRSSNSPEPGTMKLNVYDAKTGDKLEDVMLKDYVFNQPASDTTETRVVTDPETGMTKLAEGYEWNYDEFNQGIVFGPLTDMHVDAAGHLLAFSLPCEGHVMQLWKLDPATGDGELVLYLGGNSDVSDLSQWYPTSGTIRLDRFAVYGDVDKDATIIFACEGSNNVYEFDIEDGKWNGEPYETPCMNGATPSEDGTAFSYTPRLAFAEGGEAFYVDGFATYPELFDLEGNMLQSFNGVYSEEYEEIRPECLSLLYNDDVVAVSKGVCGCLEFKVGNKSFFSMAGGSYEGSYKPFGTTLIYAFQDENCNFDEMSRAWEVSADGFGGVKNAQFNYQQQAVVVDGQTTELYVYVAENGLGKYTITTDAPYVAVENVESVVTGTEKVLKNGQIYIIRNGVTYTAMGAIAE